MKRNIYTVIAIRAIIIALISFISLAGISQGAVVSTPLGIGKTCGASADSFRLMTYNKLTNSMSVTYKCKPNLGGGTPSGPAFSSSMGSIAFNPKDQNVYYVATTTGNNTFVYTWAPNSCPVTKQAWNYYYSGQFIVGMDFDPNSSAGDGYQLGFGPTAPYALTLRKVNFAGGYLGPNVSISIPSGKQVYTQNGDIIFTPQGQLYIAFDNKIYSVDFSNYGSGTVVANYIDSLRFPSGYTLTGISYAAGKFIGSTQKGSSSCSFYSIDISSGSAVLNPVTLTNGNYTATDMATLISGIGLAKKVYRAAPFSASVWYVQYDVKIRDFGNSQLNNVQVVEDLVSVFGAGKVSSASLAAVGTLPSGLTLNPSFDGVTNKNLFTSGGTMNTSSVDSATIRVSFVLTNPNVNTTYYSSSIGTASEYFFGTAITDSSNNSLGLVSDPNDNGIPDDVGEGVPTPLRLSDWIYLSNNVFDFNGNYADKKVNLHWKMVNAEAGLIANIQRSTDKKNFQTMGSFVIKESKNVESYLWTDSSPLPGDNLYRIEFVKPDGTVFYTEILSFSINNKPKSLTVAPNPFTDHISFSIDLEKAQNVQYKLLSMDSRIITTGEKTGQAGTNAFSIYNLSAIPSGTYILETIADNQIYHKVLIKPQ